MATSVLPRASEPGGGVLTPLGPSLSARSVRLWLSLVLLWGALLRLYGLTLFPDLNYFFDERYVVGPAARIAMTGNWKPDDFYWPSLPAYWAACFAVAARFFSDLWRAYTGSPLLYLRTNISMPPDAFHVARFSMVVASLLTVGLSYLLARKLYGKAPAVTAAALVAGSGYLVLKSMEATADTLLTATATLTLLLAVRAQERPTLGRYLLAGAAVGLTVGSKYNGWVVGAPLVLVALGEERPLAGLRKLVLAGLASLAVFFLLNPFILLEWPTFRENIGITRATYARKSAMRLEKDWQILPFFWLTLHTLLLRLVPATLGLYGAFASFLRRNRGERLVGCFVLLYVAWYAWAVKNPIAHNFLLTTPGFAVLASGVAWRALERLRGMAGLSERAYRRAGTLGALGLVVPGFVLSSQERLEARSPHTEHYLEAWIEHQAVARPMRLASDEVTVDPRRIPGPVELRPAWATTPAGFLDGADHALFAMERLREQARRFPRNAATYRRLLWSPRLSALGSLRPTSWRGRGGSYLLFAVAPPGGWALVEVRDLPLDRLRIEGDGGAQADLAWIRGEGARASLELSPGVAAGEALALELRLGADDSTLAVPGDLIEVGVGIDGAGATHAVECSVLRDYTSGLILARSDTLALELTLQGGEGGRVYATRLRLFRHVAAASLGSRLVDGRLEELDLVERAGL